MDRHDDMMHVCQIV